MKVEIELPKLEVIMEEAKKRGFNVTLRPLRMDFYWVDVTCEGHTKKAGVKVSRNGRVTLDTGRWYAIKEKDRLRISVHKRVNVIGDRISWMLGAMGNRKKNVEEIF